MYGIPRSQVAQPGQAIPGSRGKHVVAVQSAVPLIADLCINFDLPTSKELHMRRVSRVLGPAEAAPRVCALVHVVVAGQMAEFRALEKFTNAAIQEMPVHAGDILLPDRMGGSMA